MFEDKIPLHEQLVRRFCIDLDGIDVKKIKVAAAVIVDEKQRIFLARRSQEAHQGGKWEFPGGKLELGETSFEALKRELFEELGIEANNGELFLQVSHQYPDKAVVLDVYIVCDYQGEPWGKEGQQTMWAKGSELYDLEFPAANAEIVEKLQQWLVNNNQ